MSKTKNFVTEMDQHFHELFFALKLDFFHLWSNKFHIAKINGILDSCESFYNDMVVNNQTLMSILESEQETIGNSKLAAVLKKACDGVKYISYLFDLHLKQKEDTTNFGYVSEVCQVVDKIEVDECFYKHLGTILNLDFQSFIEPKTYIEDEHHLCS